MAMTAIERLQKHYNRLLVRTRADPIPAGIGLCWAFSEYLNVPKPLFFDENDEVIDVPSNIIATAANIAYNVINACRQEAEMQNEDGFLEGSEIKRVLKGLQKEANELIQRHIKQAQAEEALKVKRDKLDADGRAFIQTLLNAGITSIKLADGSELTVKEKYHLSVNKNAGDIQTVTEFLRNHNADHLVNAYAKVTGDSIETLQVAGIPYEEVTSVNTTSVKAWLLDQMGKKGGEVYIQEEELPKGLSFYIERVLSM